MRDGMKPKALGALGCLLLAVMLFTCIGERDPQDDARSLGEQGEAGEIGKTGPQDDRRPNNRQSFGNSGNEGIVKNPLNNDGELEHSTSQPPRSPLNKPKFPRLDSTLNKVVGQIGSGMTADIASSVPVYIGDLVAVTVRLSHKVSNTIAFLESVGAIVANIGTDYIEAYTPVTSLVSLSERDGVLKVEVIIPSEPAVTDN